MAAAQSARESVLAQQRAAQHEVSIVKTKGQADIEAARQKLRQAEASLELAKANTASNPAYQQGLKALRVDKGESGQRPGAAGGCGADVPD